MAGASVPATLASRMSFDLALLCEGVFLEGVVSWFDYMSSRTDLIAQGLTQTLVYVVVVTIAATITAIVSAIATLRHPFAKELALAISSVFLTIPSLALFTIFIPIVGLGFTPSFIALYLYAIMPILRNTVNGPGFG